MDVLVWLEQSWVILVAIIGGITLIWNFFNKTVKEIRNSVISPLEDLRKEIADISSDSKLTKEALLTMQRKSLLDSCEFYLRQGYVPMNDRVTLARQYDSYCALGGNSFIHDLYEKIDSLPLEPED